MKKPIIGIQLYTLRDYIKTPEDFDKTLARLEKMGVTDVQISAIGDFDAETQAQILKKHSMRVCITHKSYEQIINEPEKLVNDHKTIGCDAIGMGYSAEELRRDAECTAKFISSVQTSAEIFKKSGMTFNYHNHDFEFKNYENSDLCMMDQLLKDTDPELFHFIPDVAWIDYAGQNPSELLKKMAGRVKVVHFKDYIIDENGKRRFVSLGKGVVDLKKCYETICELGIPYIMYEQDDAWTDGDAFISCEESWEYLKMLDSQN